MSSPTVAEQLVLGGRALIGREGTGDLSVRRLVEAAGRSTMCVYSHFGNRKRLLAEVYRSCGDDLLAALANARTANGLERDYAAYARSEPRHFQYLFAADLDGFGLDQSLRLDLIASVLDLAAARLDSSGGASDGSVPEAAKSGTAKGEGPQGKASKDAALAWWLRVHAAVWLDTVQRLAGQPDRFDTAAALKGPA
ncbi:TetR/AcrR family transcriptional regulator [Glycomyces tritici]|uniref:TetR/AcrR family transcriptional regulator n=1 Tax=Glycomyces tritici TaxID=2665176 RepID=A0ABT7YSV4_9ACTN|nr:TetR/AcrR family transcriptional regulator [Glycomyces tritici]MDN3241722.1 TetR/AcrR family transcriptional regulator [Glycomyces tritici]